MNYIIPPWDHQRSAVEFFKDRDCGGLFFEQGAGKTSTMINILRYKYGRAGRIMKTLILGPPIVVDNWRKEWAQYSNVREHNVFTLTGSAWQRMRSLERIRMWCMGNNDQAVVITSYSSLLMPEVFKSLMRERFEVMVCDESHQLKSLTAKRTKKAVELSERSHSRWILTGTPILNSPMDIFSQYLIMDQGKTFSASYRDFRDEYFRDDNRNMPRAKYFPNWQPKSGAFERLNKEIYKSAIRVLKKDCLDLPPLVRQLVGIDLTTEQRRLYDQVEKDFVAELDSGQVVVSDLAITKAIRLQQIASGYVPTDDGTIHEFKDDPRARALEELLTSLTFDHKVIVWAVFKQNYEAIRRVCRKLKVSFTEVHGQVSPTAKSANVELFNENPDCRVLIGHPASAGIGINLVPASYAIFYSRNFSLEQDEQAQARNYRGGSEIHEKVTRIDLVANGTIDEVVLTALAAKQDVSSAILQSLKRGTFK